MCFSLFGQRTVYVDDTISVKYSNAGQFLKFKDLPYDALTGFQQYRTFGATRLPMARSGNIGLPVHSYKIEVQDWNIFHHTGAYQMYLFQKDSMRYYQMSRPFTQLRYTNGTESEQLFNVLHSQNVGKGLNFSFEYQRTTSEGFFLEQLTNHTQFNATYNLTNRSARFRSRGYFLINDLEAQENGGVVLSDNQEEESNTVFLDVNLRGAQNQIRANSLGILNEYDLLYTDSLNVLLNLSHDFSLSRSYRKYQDDTTNSADFFDSYFLDNVNSADSGFTQAVENVLFFNFFNKSINLGVKNVRYQYLQNFLIDERLTSNYVSFQVNKELFGLQFLADLEKGVSGFQKEEQDIRTSIQFPDIKEIKATVSYVNTKKQADYLLMNQRINHHIFNNEFKTSDFNSLNVQLFFKKYKARLETGINRFTNYIYYDSTARPQQNSDAISSFYAELHKQFKIRKHWNLITKIRYQTNSNEGVIPLPELYSYNSLFYENLFFKKSLLFQIGVDFYYIGQYNGYRYDPSLAQLYLNGANRSLGEDAQLDIFINMRINKSARIFLKMENVFSSSFDEDTYRIQNYPIPGKVLKIGLSWRMIN